MYYEDSMMGGGALAAFAGMLGVIWVISMVFCIFAIVCMWKIFQKAGYAGWKIFHIHHIPVYMGQGHHVLIASDTFCKHRHYVHDLLETVAGF